MPPMLPLPLLLLLNVLPTGCLATGASPGTNLPCLSTDLPVDTLSRMVETVNHWTLKTLRLLPRLAAGIGSLAPPGLDRPTNRPI
jgi:hypothetical protein